MQRVGQAMAYQRVNFPTNNGYRPFIMPAFTVPYIGTYDINASGYLDGVAGMSLRVLLISQESGDARVIGVSNTISGSGRFLIQGTYPLLRNSQLSLFVQKIGGPAGDVVIRGSRTNIVRLS